jgi:hypothetical protein
MPALRRRVAALEGPVSELSLGTSAATVPYGSAPAVSGALVLPGRQPGAGETIELRSLAGGRETVVGSTTTGPDGGWSIAPPPMSRSAVLRAVFAGAGRGRPGVISPVAGVGVVPALGISAEQSSVPAGGSAIVDGTVRPSKARVAIAAYRVLANGGLKRVATRSAAASAGGFRASIRFSAAGTYRLVASVPADAVTAAGLSAPVDVHVGG